MKEYIETVDIILLLAIFVLATYMAFKNEYSKATFWMAIALWLKMNRAH